MLVNIEMYSLICIICDHVWQYFYNPETCQFLYWCYETQSYYPVPTDVGSEAQTAETVSLTNQTQASNADNNVVTTSDDSNTIEHNNSESVNPASSPADDASHTASEDKSKKEKAVNAKKIVKVCICWSNFILLA